MSKQALTWQKVQVGDTKYQVFLLQNSMKASTGRNYAMHKHSFQAATFLHKFYSLHETFPIELSPNIGIISICTVQDGSHWCHMHIQALEIWVVPMRN